MTPQQLAHARQAAWSGLRIAAREAAQALDDAQKIDGEDFWNDFAAMVAEERKP